MQVGRKQAPPSSGPRPAHQAAQRLPCFTGAQTPCHPLTPPSSGTAAFITAWECGTLPAGLRPSGLGSSPRDGAASRPGAMASWHLVQGSRDLSEQMSYRKEPQQAAGRSTKQGGPRQGASTPGPRAGPRGRQLVGWPSGRSRRAQGAAAGGAGGGQGTSRGLSTMVGEGPGTGLVQGRW